MDVGQKMAPVFVAPFCEKGDNDDETCGTRGSSPDVSVRDVWTTRAIIKGAGSDGQPEHSTDLAGTSKREAHNPSRG